MAVLEVHRWVLLLRSCKLGMCCLNTHTCTHTCMYTYTHGFAVQKFQKNAYIPVHLLFESAKKATGTHKKYEPYVYMSYIHACMHACIHTYIHI